MSELPECDKEVWSHGEHIATIIDIPSAKIEEIVKGIAKKTKTRTDWHYVGGRAAIRILPKDEETIKRVREALFKKLAELGLENKCRSTENATSGIPMSILRKWNE